MSNQGQGLLNHFYLGFICCVLIRRQDIRWACTGPLVLWLLKLAFHYEIVLPISRIFSIKSYVVGLIRSA